MDPITSVGIAGMQRGLSQATDNSNRLSTAFLPDSNNDPVAAIVDLQNATRQVQASAVTVKTGKDLQKHLLDIFG